MNNELNKILKNLYLPPNSSHKGQNGKLLIIGGSTLFHAASLWALKVASRIVDLVHYSSILENNKIVHELKKEFRDGIVVPRSEIENYIQEDDCILIGPGMMRSKAAQIGNWKLEIGNLADLEKYKDEGLQTRLLTNYLLRKYQHKNWVIDAGALQMIDPEWIPRGSILTPHKHEFEKMKFRIQNSEFRIKLENLELRQQLEKFAAKYKCILLLKGEVDIACNGLTGEYREIAGGNSGMTKGGTGDVLAGLIAALVCKNDPWLATVAGSFINKKAGEELFKKVGYFFNASDLADEIPRTMNKMLIGN
jgi:hydroxyethylthiazole kinase-like uncharacterized protein yjeF